MEHPEIKLLLELPAVRLLRSPHAAMVLGFFYRAFKHQLRVALPEGELQAMLETYLEELEALDSQGFPGPAAEYLNRWCEDSHGYLRKYYGEDRQEPNAGRIRRRGARKGAIYVPATTAPAHGRQSAPTLGQFETPDGSVTIPLSAPAREVLKREPQPPRIPTRVGALHRGRDCKKKEQGENQAKFRSPID